MLSLFPDLLDWSWYAPFLFRIFLGVYSCYLGWILAKEQSTAATAHDHAAWLGMRIFLMLIGILFILGLATQALGAVGFSLALFALFLKWKQSPHSKESTAFYLLAGLVSLSLVLLGAGPYAIDLPL